MTAREKLILRFAQNDMQACRLGQSRPSFSVLSSFMSLRASKMRGNPFPMTSDS